MTPEPFDNEPKPAPSPDALADTPRVEDFFKNALVRLSDAKEFASILERELLASQREVKALWEGSAVLQSQIDNADATLEMAKSGLQYRHDKETSAFRSEVATLKQEPVSLFEAANAPEGSISRIHQYDARACCKMMDELRASLTASNAKLEELTKPAIAGVLARMREPEDAMTAMRENLKVLDRIKSERDEARTKLSEALAEITPLKLRAADRDEWQQVAMKASTERDTLLAELAATKTERDLARGGTIETKCRTCGVTQWVKSEDRRILSCGACLHREQESELAALRERVTELEKDCQFWKAKMPLGDLYAEAQSQLRRTISERDTAQAALVTVKRELNWLKEATSNNESVDVTNKALEQAGTFFTGLTQGREERLTEITKLHSQLEQANIKINELHNYIATNTQ